MGRNALGALALLLLLSSRIAVADVVPPRAVEVADAWLALVDRGRYREAVDRYFDASEPEAAKEMLARLGRGHRPVKIASRTIASWTGHGDGDQSRMAPGGWFGLVYDTVEASGRKAIDEVRLVPDGREGWRVVGYVRR